MYRRLDRHVEYGRHIAHPASHRYGRGRRGVCRAHVDEGLSFVVCQCGTDNDQIGCRRARILDHRVGDGAAISRPINRLDALPAAKADRRNDGVGRVFQCQGQGGAALGVHCKINRTACIARRSADRCRARYRGVYRIDRDIHGTVGIAQARAPLQRHPSCTLGHHKTHRRICDGVSLAIDIHRADKLPSVVTDRRRSKRHAIFIDHRERQFVQPGGLGLYGDIKHANDRAHKGLYRCPADGRGADGRDVGIRKAPGVGNGCADHREIGGAARGKLDQGVDDRCTCGRQVQRADALTAAITHGRNTSTGRVLQHQGQSWTALGSHRKIDIATATASRCIDRGSARSGGSGRANAHIRHSIGVGQRR